MIKLPSFENKFHFVLGLSALFVASVAAFFSVMGIGMLFSGATISAMIMASSLELGKVVGTTYLYRYWDKTTKMLKTYLCLAIAMLVVITSLGVFGWLSSAYQSSALQYEMSQQQVSTLVVQKDAILNQAEESKQRISEITKLRSDQEARMNDALSSPILSRNPTALRQVQDQNISLINQTDEDLRTERAHYNDFQLNGS
jgi:sensor histidine kinase regulating citrate/malate metabolism